jgi:hypothetical protein
MASFLATSIRAVTIAAGSGADHAHPDTRPHPGHSRRVSARRRLGGQHGLRRVRGTPGESLVIAPRVGEAQRPRVRDPPATRHGPPRPLTPASSNARRVFPTPPGPVSVTTRVLRSVSPIASSSRPRPTNDVRTTGTLCSANATRVATGDEHFAIPAPARPAAQRAPAQRQERPYAPA